MNYPIAVLVAVVASITFAASDVIEQRATHTVTERQALDPRLFKDLVANRSWRVGILVDIAASALQAVALHFGPLALVQPLLVLNLPFAALISRLAAHARPDRVIITGVLSCTGGLALFLAVARPHGGSNTVSPTADVLPLAVGLAATIALCLAVAHFGPRQSRSLAAALACGVVFGITAFLLKELTQTLPKGFSPPTQQWPLYAFIVLEPAGFLLNQNAFQESNLIAPVLSIRTAADPLVAIAIGVLWLDEQIASGAANIAAEVIGLVIMTLGIIVTARRAPQLAGLRNGLVDALLAESRRPGAIGSTGSPQSAKATVRASVWVPGPAIPWVRGLWNKRSCWPPTSARS
ncbi:MAG TPA: DMT family transporter [Trebonia sp.]